MAVGIHIIADLYGVESDIIAEADRMYPIIENAVKVGKLTKISSDYYQFQPRGSSGVVLLAESHLSFHTWPEHGLVTLDIYTCGDPRTAEEAFQYIVDRLKPSQIDCKRLKRGDLIEEEVKAIKPQQMLIP